MTSENEQNEQKRFYSTAEAARLRDDFGWNDITEQEALAKMNRTEWLSCANLQRIAKAIEQPYAKPYACLLREARAKVEWRNLCDAATESAYRGTKVWLVSCLGSGVAGRCWKALAEKLRYGNIPFVNINDTVHDAVDVLTNYFDNNARNGFLLRVWLGQMLQRTWWTCSVADIPPVFKKGSKAHMAWTKLVAGYRTGRHRP